MIVLGIETSCDETSVAIVEKKKNEKFGRVLNEITLSQIEKHKSLEELFQNLLLENTVVH